MTEQPKPTQPLNINILIDEPPTFVNPFDDSTSTNRFVSNVDSLVYQWYYSVHPTKGTQQTTVNLLLNKLRNELIRRNITDFTKQPEFEAFVAGCRLISADEYLDFAKSRLLGSAPARTDAEVKRTGQEADGQDVPGRVTGGGQAVETVKDGGTVVQSSAGTRVDRTGGESGPTARAVHPRNVAVKTKKVNKNKPNKTKPTPGQG